MKLQDIGIIQFQLLNNPNYQKIINSAKEFISHRPNDHIVVFNSYNELVDTKNVPILHLNQSKFFHGNLLVFDIKALEFAKLCINKKSIIYYAKDIPWSNTIQNFFYWQDLFIDTNIQIVASNQEIYDIFSIGIKPPIHIATEFSYEAFKKIL